MNIRITDKGGLKPTFTQWDVDRVLLISGCESQPSLRFDNPELSRSIVVVAEADGSDWKCNVPNFMLQFSGPMIVSAFIQPDEGKTVFTARYAVQWAKKPQDYTYEENIGYVNWVEKSEEAQELLDDIEDLRDEIQTAVNTATSASEAAVAAAEDIDETVAAALQAAKDSGDFDGADGQDGQDGAPGPKGDAGEDGVSPRFSSTAIIGGHRVTVQDAYGDYTFDVMDGAAGATGATGPQGPKGDKGDTGAKGDKGDDGQDGADGKDGADGVGVPSGGTTGQFLRKQSATDYDTVWETVQTDRFDKELVILTPAVGRTAYTWTNGTAWSSSGGNTSSSLSTRSGKKSISPGAIVQNKSAASVNGKSLYVHVVEWAGNTFVRRTYLQTGKYVIIGSTTDTYALNFAYDSGQSAPNMDAATLAANFAVRVIDKEIPRKTSELTNDAGFVTHGIPAGGSSGQVLKKASGTDYDTVWANESGGGGGSISPYTSNPAALGTASPGVSDAYARGDHVHPMPSIPEGADEIEWTGGNLGQLTPPQTVEGAVGVVYDAIPTTASDVGAVAVSQGVAHAGEFVVVGSDGNITTVTMSVWQGGSY